MNKRQWKKQQKKTLQRDARRYQKILKLSDRDIKNASVDTLKSIPKKAKTVQRKQQRERLHDKKINLLKEKGFDTSSLTKKQVEHIHLKDIESNKIKLKDYPYLFDFNKVKKLPPNRHLYITYMDYSGERSFEEILRDYENMSDKRLLELLNHIVNMPKTFSRFFNTGSSGSAGESKFYFGDKDVIKDFDRDVKQEDARWKNHPKRKRHTGAYKGHQTLTDEYGNIDIGEVTGHGLLVIMNAIMHNVTEEERDTFYRDITNFLRRSFVDFYRLLPKSPKR